MIQKQNQEQPRRWGKLTIPLRHINTRMGTYYNQLYLLV